MKINRPVLAGDKATIVFSKKVGLTVSVLGIGVNDETITGMCL